MNNSSTAAFNPSSCLENVEVELDVEMKDPYVFLDADQMMQVLTNLENDCGSHAGWRCPPHKVVAHNGDVEISISDTGTGISEQNLEKVFTPFFTTKEVGKGTGLGLPLCYGIVKMHQGKIQVSSNDKSAKGPTGTTFTIKLPRNPK